MSVNPIDLQINFGQMGTVGKQQILAKDQELLKQAAAASELEKSSEKDSDDVPDVKRDSAEGGVIKDKHESQSKFSRHKNSDVVLEEVDEEEVENTKSISDPDIGRKIDLIG